MFYMLYLRPMYVSSNLAHNTSLWAFHYNVSTSCTVYDSPTVSNYDAKSTHYTMQLPGNWLYRRCTKCSEMLSVVYNYLHLNGKIQGIDNTLYACTNYLYIHL